MGCIASRSGRAREETQREAAKQAHPPSPAPANLPTVAAVVEKLAEELRGHECHARLQTEVPVREAYELGKLLGKGGFATVSLGTRRADGKRFAVKVMRMPRPGAQRTDNDNTWQDVAAEIAILARLQHPNVVQLEEVYVEADTVYLVTKLVEGGELLDAVLATGIYTEETARACVGQLVTALAYCHGRGIAHRDVKLENLLLARPGDITAITLVDFGLAKRSADNILAMQTVCGTPQYVAPEVVARRPNETYGAAVDMWACGVILYMLLSGAPPFYHDDDKQLFKLIRNGSFSFQDPVWDLISAEAKDLITKLLVVEPEARITAEAALKHPWLCASAACPSTHLAGALANMKLLPGR